MASFTREGGRVPEVTMQKLTENLYVYINIYVKYVYCASDIGVWVSPVIVVSGFSG